MITTQTSLTAKASEWNGYGRAFDNVVEKLWRRVRDEFGYSADLEISVFEMTDQWVEDGYLFVSVDITFTVSRP